VETERDVYKHRLGWHFHIPRLVCYMDNQMPKPAAAASRAPLSAVQADARAVAAGVAAALGDGFVGPAPINDFSRAQNRFAASGYGGYGGDQADPDALAVEEDDDTVLMAFELADAGMLAAFSPPGQPVPARPLLPLPEPPGATEPALKGGRPLTALVNTVFPPPAQAAYTPLGHRVLPNGGVCLVAPTPPQATGPSQIPDPYAFIRVEGPFPVVKAKDFKAASTATARVSEDVDAVVQPHFMGGRFEAERAELEKRSPRSRREWGRDVVRACPKEEDLDCYWFKVSKHYKEGPLGRKARKKARAEKKRSAKGKGKGKGKEANAAEKIKTEESTNEQTPLVETDSDDTSSESGDDEKHEKDKDENETPGKGEEAAKKVAASTAVTAVGESAEEVAARLCASPVPRLTVTLPLILPPPLASSTGETVTLVRGGAPRKALWPPTSQPLQPAAARAPGGIAAERGVNRGSVTLSAQKPRLQLHGGVGGFDVGDGVDIADADATATDSTPVSVHRRALLLPGAPGFSDQSQGANSLPFYVESLGSALESGRFMLDAARGAHGGVFRASFTQGPYPIAAARALLHDLVAALRQAHSTGVVHRDIKPENLLLARSRLLLADWGQSLTLPAPPPRHHPAAEGVVTHQRAMAGAATDSWSGLRLTDFGLFYRWNMLHRSIRYMAASARWWGLYSTVMRHAVTRAIERWNRVQSLHLPPPVAPALDLFPYVVADATGTGFFAPLSSYGMPPAPPARPNASPSLVLITVPREHEVTAPAVSPFSISEQQKNGGDEVTTAPADAEISADEEDATDEGEEEEDDEEDEDETTDEDEDPVDAEMRRAHKAAGDEWMRDYTARELEAARLARKRERWTRWLRRRDNQGPPPEMSTEDKRLLEEFKEREAEDTSLEQLLTEFCRPSLLLRLCIGHAAGVPMGMPAAKQSAFLADKYKKMETPRRLLHPVAIAPSEGLFAEVQRAKEIFDNIEIWRVNTRYLGMKRPPAVTAAILAARKQKDAAKSGDDAKTSELGNAFTAPGFAAIASAALASAPRLSGTSSYGRVQDSPGALFFSPPEALLGSAAGPESQTSTQAPSNGYDAFAADVYAAGLCFYTMLFGMTPFAHLLKREPSTSELLAVDADREHARGGGDGDKKKAPTMPSFDEILGMAGAEREEAGAFDMLQMMDDIAAVRMDPFPLGLCYNPREMVETEPGVLALDLLRGMLAKKEGERLSLAEIEAHPFLAEVRYNSTAVGGSVFFLKNALTGRYGQMDQWLAEAILCRDPRVWTYPMMREMCVRLADMNGMKNVATSWRMHIIVLYQIFASFITEPPLERYKKRLLHKELRPLYPSVSVSQRAAFRKENKTIPKWRKVEVLPGVFMGRDGWFVNEFGHIIVNTDDVIVYTAPRRSALARPVFPATEFESLPVYTCPELAVLEAAVLRRREHKQRQLESEDGSGDWTEDGSGDYTDEGSIEGSFDDSFESSVTGTIEAGLGRKDLLTYSVPNAGQPMPLGIATSIGLIRPKAPPPAGAAKYRMSDLCRLDAASLQALALARIASLHTEARTINPAKPYQYALVKAYIPDFNSPAYQAQIQADGAAQHPFISQLPPHLARAHLRSQLAPITQHRTGFVAPNVREPNFITAQMARMAGKDAQLGYWCGYLNRCIVPNRERKKEVWRRNFLVVSDRWLMVYSKDPREDPRQESDSMYTSDGTRVGTNGITLDDTDTEKDTKSKRGRFPWSSLLSKKQTISTTRPVAGTASARNPMLSSQSQRGARGPASVAASQAATNANRSTGGESVTNSSQVSSDSRTLSSYANSDNSSVALATQSVSKPRGLATLIKAKLWKKRTFKATRTEAAAHPGAVVTSEAGVITTTGDGAATVTEGTDDAGKAVMDPSKPAEQTQNESDPVVTIAAAPDVLGPVSTQAAASLMEVICVPPIQSMNIRVAVRPSPFRPFQFYIGNDSRLFQFDSLSEKDWMEVMRAAEKLGMHFF
jgi:serine/threonine protein kinase